MIRIISEVCALASLGFFIWTLLFLAQVLVIQ